MICNDPDIVRLLVRHKANTSSVNDDGDTALHLGVMDDDEPYGEALLAMKADPGQRNAQNLTVAESARNLGSTSCLELLLSHSSIGDTVTAS